MASRLKTSRTLIANLLLIAPLLSLIFMTAMKNTAYDRQILVNSHKLYVQTVDTEKSREKGLSGRDSMRFDQGMLFIFSPPAQECMWMREMRFNLDIVWINSQNKVIKIVKNATPDTYPEIFCAASTKYVIELNTGATDSLGLNVGDSVRL